MRLPRMFRDIEAGWFSLPYECMDPLALPSDRGSMCGM